ncbi:MAG: hypothetical protein GY835_28335 [bacterium]|nr:hypothetical protein [bacterium]
MIGSAVTILANLAGIHSWFTGIRTGQVHEHLLKEAKRTRHSVERLTEHILAIESIVEVKDITKSEQPQLHDKRQVCELLDPVQRGLGEDILTTAVILTPEKLQKAVAKDPWEVLMEIRPAARAKQPVNPDMVPIIFSEENNIYIGWQTRGAFPMLFDCEYVPDRDLYLPYERSSQPSSPIRSRELSPEIPSEEEEEEQRRQAEAAARRQAEEQEKRRQAGAAVRCPRLYGLGPMPRHVREKIKENIRKSDPNSTYPCPSCNVSVKVKNLIQHVERKHYNQRGKKGNKKDGDLLEWIKGSITRFLRR